MSETLIGRNQPTLTSDGKTRTHGDREYESYRRYAKLRSACRAWHKAEGITFQQLHGRYPRSKLISDYLAAKRRLDNERRAEYLRLSRAFGEEIKSLPTATVTVAVADTPPPTQGLRFVDCSTKELIDNLQTWNISLQNRLDSVEKVLSQVKPETPGPIEAKLLSLCQETQTEPTTCSKACDELKAEVERLQKENTSLKKSAAVFKELVAAQREKDKESAMMSRQLAAAGIIDVSDFKSEISRSVAENTMLCGIWRYHLHIRAGFNVRQFKIPERDFRSFFSPVKVKDFNELKAYWDRLNSKFKIQLETPLSNSALAEYERLQQ